MNKRIVSLIIIMIACASLAAGIAWWRMRMVSALRTCWQQVDFDIATAVDAYSDVVNRAHNQRTYTFFKELYAQNNPTMIAPSYAPKIPKIIHQIWLGGEVPQEFQAFIASWKQVHPDWEYRLWRDADIEAFGLINKDLYDAAPNYGEKSDLARYEILYRVGGVYADVDCQALQPLTLLHHAYDFYIGIEPLDSTHVQVGNAIIGSASGHPILAHAIEKVREHKDQPTTVLRTGPLFLTQVFVSCAHQPEYTNIALPPHYFFPLKCKETVLNEGHATMLTCRWITQGSLAVHHWAKSWSHPLFRWPKFRALNEADKWLDVDFDTAMGGTPQVLESDEPLLQMFKAVYEKDKLSKAFLTPEPRMPKVVHQVWLRSDMPSAVITSIQSWRKNNPHWEYKLWGRDDIVSLVAPYRAVFDAADEKTQQLIAGYAILYAHGGVYADTDVQCVQPIDCLNHAYHFYAGLQPLHDQHVRLATGVIGACPGGPIIAHCLKTIDLVLKNPKTHLTQAFIDGQKGSGISIGLPASYFSAKASDANKYGVFAVS